ncbi:zinc finger CCCH domain-containing protein 32-like [Magnolia sinica]|uniref:zinc finger CCCH domain-containing protein 32-like n=1 Tax=Magnolia sinica TaxID=86752 RepID=UPI002659D190|nr:zinc finger CCCH domain-containing protein 32-like [Magnolia sinica]
MEYACGDSSRPNRSSPAEDEVKRHTDCLYFLASPLTCKKGNECEFRHSEGARVNPRDCWYWLNGNCMNPKCSFRHLPLDGLVGTPGTASAGSSLPASQATASMQMPATHTAGAYNSNKQGVPCFYFQKGVCLKGDRCPFMHGSQPINNSAQQQVPRVAASVTEPPQALQQAIGAIKKCSTQLKIPKVHTVKPVEIPPTAEPDTKAETLLNNGVAIKKNLPPNLLVDGLPRLKPATAPVVSANIVRPLSQPVQWPSEHFLNGREAGEFFGESSPGFDVLVEDEVDDSDYFCHENDLRKNPGQIGKRLNSVNKFDHDSASKHSSRDRVPYDDFSDHNRYRRLQDQSGWEHQRDSSERILERPSLLERGSRVEGSPDRINGSDLRYQLSKRRRVNGSRSATSSDRHAEFYWRDDRYTEEQGHRGRSHSDQRHPLESSISNRLQGRIMLPERSSPEKDLYSDREMDRRSYRVRSSSPGRLISHQGRHHDRLRRTQEDLTTEMRNVRSRQMKRHEPENLKFAAPKSLSKLKVAKVSDNSEGILIKRGNASVFKNRVVVGEQKNMKLGKVVHQEPEGSLSFEGPKPLSVILKRKREGMSGNGPVSIDEESNKREHASDTAVTETQTVASVMPTIEANHDFSSHEEPSGVTVNTVGTSEQEEEYEEGLIAKEGDELVHGDQSSPQKEDTVNMEDSMKLETMEDQELGMYDQRDGEYDYEPDEGGDSKMEEKNADDPEDECFDDEDDFARRIGVLFE